MTDWAEVVAALGDDAVDATDATHAHATDAAHRPGRVTRLVIEPSTGASTAQDLVLAVGHDGPRAFHTLLDGLGEVGGVVVRSRADNADRLVRAARDRGVAAVVLAPHADWLEVIHRLRTVLRAAAPEFGPWDLFEIAATAAGIAGGPVTIEDPESRVLAYGGDHATADPARIASILDRRVPDQVTARLEAAGVRQRLTGERGTIFVEGIEELAPRIAAGIRAGPDLVGTAWAIVPEPPGAAVLAEFARCVALAAVPLVRATRSARPAGSVDNDGFAALLYGGAGTRHAAESLALAGRDASVAVLAVRGGDLVESARLRARLRARIVAMGRLAESHIADLNGTLFVIAPSTVFTPPGLARWLEDTVLTRIDAPPGTTAVAGIGQASPVEALPRSRAQAELALAIAGDTGTSAARTYAATWAQSFVRRLAELPVATELDAFGPVIQLRDHDARNATDYLPTLEAHLLTGGDARRAAERLHVHPNTYRYRMRRIHELIALDLDAIDIHAAVSVQLALHRRSQPQKGRAGEARADQGSPPGSGPL